MLLESGLLGASAANNGMHSSANSAALIRKTWMVSRSYARRVMPGVGQAECE